MPGALCLKAIARVFEEIRDKPALTANCNTCFGLDSREEIFQVVTGKRDRRSWLEERGAKGHGLAIRV